MAHSLPDPPAGDSRRALLLSLADQLALFHHGRPFVETSTVDQERLLRWVTMAFRATDPDAQACAVARLRAAGAVASGSRWVAEVIGELITQYERDLSQLDRQEVHRHG